MSGIPQLDLSAEQLAEYQSMCAHASTMTYAELVIATASTAEKLQEEEQQLVSFPIKLDSLGEAIAKRLAELAFEPSITVESDPPLKRFRADQDRLTTSYRHVRESIERKKLVVRISRDELSRRGAKRDALVTERVFKLWQADSIEVAYATARAAIVHAMLVKAGHATTRPGFDNAAGFMRETLNGESQVSRLVAQAEENERARQQAIVVEQDKNLG